MHAIETRRLQYRAGKTFAIEGLDLQAPLGSIYGR